MEGRRRRMYPNATDAALRVSRGLIALEHPLEEGGRDGGLADGFGNVFPPLPVEDLVLGASAELGKKPATAGRKQLPANCHLPRRSRKRARTIAIPERDTGLEPATFGLGSRRSTN